MARCLPLEQASELVAAPRKPRGLRAGARVALVAPAGPVSPERLQRSVERCHQLGLEPVIYGSAHLRHRYLAGPDSQRLADLQAALDDPAVDGVWALRGGFGTTRIVRQLDLRALRMHPKPFIGFSDNTAIHALFGDCGLVSFHGPHPGGDFPLETAEAFQRVLFCAAPAGILPTRNEDPKPATVVPGLVEAPLIGGNLAILAALCGTPAAVRARGHILFLEDVGEPAYRLDRMLVQLRDAGALDGVLGLALGRFTETSEQQEGDACAVLREFAESLEVPAVMDLPIGHVEHNWTLPLGVTALLDADAATLQITDTAVTE